MNFRALGLLTLLALTAAPAHAADDLLPDTPTTSATATAPSVEPLSASLLTNPQWWKGFHDSKLSSLMLRAQNENLSVLAAGLRASEAKTVARQQGASLLPTLSWESGFDLAPSSALGFRQGGTTARPQGPSALPSVYWSGSSSLNAAYEIDILGNRGLQHRASRDDWQATKLTVDTDALAILASTATAYFDLVAARARALIVEEQITTAETLLALTVARFNTGRARATDILQQRQQLASTLTLRPRAHALVRGFSQQLAVLLGDPPQTVHSTATSLPTLAGPTPAVNVESVVSGRSDVRAAELRIAAANKRERASPTYFSPRLSVSANAGVQAIALTELNHQLYWGAGAKLSIPLFAGGNDLAKHEQLHVQSLLATNQLQQRKLQARQQLLAALAAEQEQTSIVATTENALMFARQSYEALRARYLQGEGEVTTLLTAFNAHRQAELDLLTARRNLVVARVTLHSSATPGLKTGNTR